MWARRLLARPTSSGATTGGSLYAALDAGPATGLADSASRTIRRENNRRLIIPPDESPRQIGPARGSGRRGDSMFDVLADVFQQRRAEQRLDDRRSSHKFNCGWLVTVRSRVARPA